MQVAIYCALQKYPMRTTGDEIERLRTENAELRQRLTVDDAMVERASHALNQVVNARWDGILGDANTLVLVRAALEAALGVEMATPTPGAVYLDGCMEAGGEE